MVPTSSAIVRQPAATEAAAAAIARFPAAFLARRDWKVGSTGISSGSGRGSNTGVVSERTAPPWVRARRPSFSSSVRSRRTVISETPSWVAASATDTAPVSASTSRIQVWRRRARTLVRSPAAGWMSASALIVKSSASGCPTGRL